MSLNDAAASADVVTPSSWPVNHAVDEEPTSPESAASVHDDRAETGAAVDVGWIVEEFEEDRRDESDDVEHELADVDIVADVADGGYISRKLSTGGGRDSAAKHTVD